MLCSREGFSTLCRGIDILENLVIPALVACAVSLVLSLGSFLWSVVYSTPSHYKKSVDQTHAAAKQAVRIAEETQGLFLVHRGEMGAMQESMEGVLESVERKRKQISGAASRLKIAEEPPIPLTRGEIVAATRAKVYGGG